MDTYELLQHLGEVDPVDPELLDSVVGELLALGGESDASAGVVRQVTPATNVLRLADHVPLAAGHRDRRSGYGAGRRVLWATAASSAALVVAVATLLGLGVLPSTARPNVRPITGRHEPAAQRASTGFRLVDAATSPFSTVGAGSSDGDLTCVTAMTCYADEIESAIGAPHGVERTTDGGRTWHFVAAVPGGATLNWPLSCPTALMCVGLATQALSSQDQERIAAAQQAVESQDTPGQPSTAKERQASANMSKLIQAVGVPPSELVVTIDGGAHWTVETVAGSTSLPSALDQGQDPRVECATSEVCVISGGIQLFVTQDGGTTWTREPPLPTSAFTLRCAGDGTCIAIHIEGDVESSHVVALRSTDFGKTWTAGPPGPFGGAVIELDCADTTHCMAAWQGRGAIMVSSTADGGLSWQLSTVPGTAPPAGSAAEVRDLSCATGNDCWISDSVGPLVGNVATDTNATMFRTQDGGATWTQLALPLVNGAPLAIIYPLSCPSALGCIAVGATRAQFDPESTRPVVKAPAGREIISDLPKA